MHKRILFQGDSITDCGRHRDQFFNLGDGYAHLIKAGLGLDCPGEYEFINRGISGNRIVDMYARIKDDFINLKPDFASIYIGVNDAWHEIAWNNGIDTPKFEKLYEMYLDEIQAACPDVKLIIIAPYVLEGPATCATEEQPDRWARFQQDVGEKNAVCKKIAAKYGLPCIDLQAAFDEACTKAPAEYWTGDGVHPTATGHEIIKRLWLETFEQIKD